MAGVVGRPTVPNALDLKARIEQERRAMAGLRAVASQAAAEQHGAPGDEYDLTADDP